jgi:HD-GYP domain-containing protein (c-di-GMP phosphodiesterase class II)
METTSDRVARHGKSVITNLYILFRITGIYDSMNETILNIAKRLLSDMESLLQETGEFTIKIMQGTFFIEGARIKAGVSDIESFTSLADELGKKAIGVLDFRTPVSAEDLINFAYAIRSGHELSDIQSALELKPSRNIKLRGPVVLQEEDGIDMKDSEAVARRAYGKAVTAMKEMDRSIKAGRRTKLKKIKRALQFIVDSILTDESYLISFVLSRTFEHYYYYHPVNVSILSVALGKKIGFDRVNMRTLAMAAFLHDFGKVEMPMSILNKKTDFTIKEEELIKRHPIEGIKIILRSFGLNETSILAMIVSFEHHMKFDFSGYPAPLDTKMTNLFSRIVSISDDYDSLISGRVNERTRLRAKDALDRMIGGSGTIYDPSLMKAFACLFQ